MRLEGNDETNQKNLRYVLALYLIRKRIFKLKSLKKQDKEESIVLYYPKEDREFNVLNLNLKEEEVEAITAEMYKLLNYPYLDHEVPANAV